MMTMLSWLCLACTDHSRAGMLEGTRGGYSWAAEFGKVTKPMSGSPGPDTRAMGGGAAVRYGARKVVFAATGKAHPPAAEFKAQVRLSIS
jgi:hypothetical protein